MTPPGPSVRKMLHWFTALLKKLIRSPIAVHLVYIFGRYSGFISPLLDIVGIAFEMKKEFPPIDPCILEMRHFF